MIALLLPLFLAPAPACHEGGPHVPAAELVEPAPKDARAGTLHDPVSAMTKNAQAKWNQGVALLHVYDWIRAARAFNEAAKEDPKLAIAHLGLSFAHNGMGDLPAARASWKRASEMGAPPRERARIEAWGLALDAFESTEGVAPQEGTSERTDRFVAYRAALDELLKTYPQDAELLLMRGNAATPLPPGMGPYQSAASVPFFLKVLKKAPDHPAAHHYLVHAYENDGQFEKAATHAAVLAKLAPGAPHAIHMDGHGLLRTGKVAEAIARFEETDRVGAAIRKAESIEEGHDWHHSHNLYLMASALRHEGRLKDAEVALRRLADVPALGDDAELDRRDLAAFLLAAGRNDEAIAAADVLAKSRLPEARAIAHALAGEALLAQGKASDAKLRLAEARREHARIEGDREAVRSWLSSLYLDELDLALALREKPSLAQLDVPGLAMRLVRNHRAMRGPDGWIQALFRLERMAAIARDAGDWTLAASVTAAMNEHDPDYGGTHLALAFLAEHDGRKEDAAKERALAKKAWPLAN